MFKRALFIFFTLQLTQCWSARILGIFPMHSYSHYILGDTFFKELASKGHNVTFISTFEPKEKIPNYRNIHLKEAADLIKEKKIGFSTFSMPIVVITVFIYELALSMSRRVFDNEDVQNLLKSDEEFDLVVLEQFFDEPLYGFTHRFKAPIILLSTGGSNSYNNRIMGNTAPPSYIPSSIVDYTSNMNFWQRFCNGLLSVYVDFVFYVFFMFRYNNLLHEYFPDAPHLQDLMDNTSLIFLNSHPTVSAPVPLVPNMIEIGGFHIQPEQNMSADLKLFLDQAEEGVIYFSMGSNLRSSDMPKEMLQELLTTFSNIKMKVLWKYEDDGIIGKPDNVRIEKWLPQTAVLGHPNTKLFLTHGGRLSTIEAIYFGVPIIGIPIFADQYMNIAHAELSNYGIAVPFRDLTSKTLTNAIKKIFSDTRYVQEIQYRSSAMRSAKFTPLETAVYWTEYVIKHKRAPHLRNASLKLAWYQYLLLDVALFFLTCCVLIGYTFYVIVRTLFVRRLSKSESKLKAN